MTDPTILTLMVAGAALLSALSTIATLATRAAVAELKAELVAEIARTREQVARDYLPRAELARSVDQLQRRYERGPVP